MDEATEIANGVEPELHDVLEKVASALGAAFRHFLSPELADRVNQIIALELGVAHVSSLPPAAPDASGEAPVSKGKRKRAVNPDRKPRLINTFNLFQAKITRKLKENNYHDAENSRLLAVSSGMWKVTDAEWKKRFEEFYAPLLKLWNEAKLGGAKFDIHSIMAEWEGKNRVPDDLLADMERMTSTEAVLAAAKTIGADDEDGHDEEAAAAEEEAEEEEEEPKPEPEPEKPKKEKKEKKKDGTVEKKKKHRKEEEPEPAAAEEKSAKKKKKIKGNKE